MASVREAIHTALGKNDGKPIGLVDNGRIRFECGTCEHFNNEKNREGSSGICEHKDPRLHGQKVEFHWCCNRYDFPGMKTIIP